ncbi:MAG TPA: hypothetical protein VKA31_08335 [Mariprofundaceae bacterium]|nr:hypothetical protein [Mariprofundaceae bacterium]
MSHLNRLGNQFSISLSTDEDGYLGRECPSEECKGYFKIFPGTGLSGITECHCPYCGHSAEQSDFHTPDQIEYAKSMIMRDVMGAISKDLKSLEFETKPQGTFGFGLSMKVESGSPQPVHRYREQSLETHAECPSCSLKYAVFGIFAFCPDCRQHNTLQILYKNLELVSKMLDMADGVEGELAERLIENALEDCVSAFDGFGRELCRVYANAASEPKKVSKVSFQSLEGAKQKVNALFNLDFSVGVTTVEWNLAGRAFQKRHLLSHKMGVVDSEYISKSGDMQAIVGHKINIDSSEIRRLGKIIGSLGQCLSDGMMEAE